MLKQRVETIFGNKIRAQERTHKWRTQVVLPYDGRRDGLHLRCPRAHDQQGAARLALTQAEFSRLVRDHGAVLYRMAYRMVADSHEAEDLVQEVFSSAWKGRSRFDSARGERAWLVVILRRR